SEHGALRWRRGWGLVSVVKLTSLTRVVQSLSPTGVPTGESTCGFVRFGTPVCQRDRGPVGPGVKAVHHDGGVEQPPASASVALQAVSEAMLGLAGELSLEPVLERLVHAARDLVG